MSEQKSVYGLRGAESVNADFEALPVGELMPMGCRVGEAYEPVRGFKVLRVQMSDGGVHHVHTPAGRYKMVQHKAAFRPIVEGLTQAGEHGFQYVLVGTPKGAKFQVFVNPEGHDGVRLGFEVTNVWDGRSALRYTTRLDRRQTWIEVVGHRQVCSNGMKVRIPLAEAYAQMGSNPKISVYVEQQQRLTTLLSETARIVHDGTAKQKIEAMQYVAEAMRLLQEPVEAMIKAGQEWGLDTAEKAKEMIKVHVGKRYAAKVRDAFVDEPDSMWGLYNAITYVASHDETLKDTARETLKDKAADLLLHVAVVGGDRR